MMFSLEQAILDSHLIAAGDRVVAGVSGGPDSVGLLAALHAVRERIGFELAAGHVNHRLRGAASDADEALVRELCRRLDVPCHVEHVDIARVARRNGESLETCSRQERYRFFRQAAESRHFTRIALAHTADDQAETVLFRLLRGTGLRGLAGMPARRPLMRGSSAAVIRPFLQIDRQTILSRIRELGLPYRLDLSNYQSTASRNRLRHRLLPQLAREYNPRIAEGLRHVAAVAEEAQRLLTAAFDPEALVQCDPHGADAVFQVDAEALRALSPVQRLLVLECGLEQVTGDVLPLGREALRRLDGLLAGTVGAGGFHLHGGLGVWREYGAIVAGRRASGDLPPPRFVRVAGSTELQDYGLRLDVTEKAFSAAEFDVFKRGKTPWEEWLDADVAGPDWQVRGWRDGDAFHPLGLPGTKKLQDFFVDEKVPQRQRSRVPLLVSGERILWVIGRRLSQEARVTAATRRVWVVRAIPVMQSLTPAGDGP